MRLWSLTAVRVPRLARGVGCALVSAALFGLSVPAAKRLLGELPPLLLAALLYLGSGLGLWLLRALGYRRRVEAPLARADAPWLAGAILVGGAVGPVLLLWGLRFTPASTASLLLNLEGVFTALLAWFVFRENVDRRVAAGMGLIVGGGVLLSWSGPMSLSTAVGGFAIAGACLCWAIDNNLTQKVSGGDPLQIASLKGLTAGLVNLAAGVTTGVAAPRPGVVAGAMAVGLFGYGVSLACFVLALRHLGTARTGAYFSLAPFIGAAASIAALGEPLTARFAAAAILMGIGAWLHVTEVHSHEHRHEWMAHSHAHRHDDHHRHEHPPGTSPDEPHTHAHVHEPFTHTHPHYPDLHHRHRHH